MAAVEGRLFDAGLLGRLGQLLADGLRRLDVAAVRHILAHVRRQAAGGRQRDAREVVDQLGVNMLGTAEHRQARAFGCAPDAAPHMIAPAELARVFGFLMIHGRLDQPPLAKDLPSLRRTCSSS